MRKAGNLPPYCAVVKNSRSLNFLDPSGPACPVMGMLYRYLLPGNKCVINQRKIRLVTILVYYRRELNTIFWLENLKGETTSKTYSLDEAILLKRILDHDVKVWAELACIMIL